MPSPTNNPPVAVGAGKRAKSFDPLAAQAFGSAVRASRHELGLAQDEFAVLANVDRSYFGKLERGERQPSLGLMLRIAAALGLPCSELVKRVEAELAGRR